MPLKEIKICDIEKCELPTHFNFLNLLKEPVIVYGKLTVLEFVGFLRSKRNKKIYYWLCECSCPEKKIKIADTSSLRSGKLKSCGCLLFDRPCIVTHRKSKTTEYKIWYDMKRRCYTKTSFGYRWYGARGITVCDRWLESFENFLEDMGLRPSKELTLDRIDVNGNYCKENCRWATRKEQSRNQRKVKFINFNGEDIRLCDLCKKFNISVSSFLARLKRGLTVEQALTTPNRYKNRRI